MNISEDQAWKYFLKKKKSIKKKKQNKYHQTIQGDTVSSLLRSSKKSRKSCSRLPKSCKRRGCTSHSQRKKSSRSKSKNRPPSSKKSFSIKATSRLREKPYQRNNSSLRSISANRPIHNNSKKYVNSSVLGLSLTYFIVWIWACLSHGHNWIVRGKI